MKERRILLPVFLGMCASIGAGEACKAKSFSGPTYYGVQEPGLLPPAMPHMLIFSDFDMDGKPDAASLNRGSHTISILRGRGDGTFEEPRLYRVVPSGTRAAYESFAAGDLNGDLFPDIVVVDWLGSAFAVLKNDSTGDFKVGQWYKLTGDLRPTAPVIIDVDGDEDKDLVLAYAFGQSIAVFKNDGSGSFSSFSTVTVGSRPSGMAPADFDGDGDVDLAVANAGFPDIGSPSSVVIAFNDGKGSFQNILTLVEPGRFSSFYAVLAEDMDQDGKVDVLAAPFRSAAFVCCWGEGEGRFSEPHIYFFPGRMRDNLVAADFDGNGYADIAAGFADIGGGSEEGATGVVWNEGGRHFSAKPYAVLRVEDQVRWPAVADLDLDGDMDIGVVQGNLGKMAVFLNSSCRNAAFLRGDSNGDCRVNIGDVFALLGYLLVGSPEMQCLDAGDVNDDGRINMADPLYLLAYLFRGGAPPPAPFDSYGLDPTADSLDCALGGDCQDL